MVDAAPSIFNERSVAAPPISDGEKESLLDLRPIRCPPARDDSDDGVSCSCCACVCCLLANVELVLVVADDGMLLLLKANALVDRKLNTTGIAGIMKIIILEKGRLS